MESKTHIRSARLKAGLTQHEVAAIIGKSQPVFHRYECGEAIVPRDVAPKIAKALRMPVMRVLYPELES